MALMDRDPHYIAETLRFLRKLHKLTQENLAQEANLTTRTIEKVESGRHRPDEQTLRSIARALGVDVQAFAKPSPEQEARQRAEMETALRKTVIVPTHPVRTANDFLNHYGEFHAYRIDTSAVKDGEAMDIAVAMGDWLTDLDGIWSLCALAERLAYARSFAEFCKQLEAHGYICHMGQHRQRLREKGKPDLIFLIGIMSIQCKESAERERYAVIHLEGAWETIDEDRLMLAK